MMQPSTNRFFRVNRPIDPKPYLFFLVLLTTLGLASCQTSTANGGNQTNPSDPVNEDAIAPSTPSTSAIPSPASQPTTTSAPANRPSTVAENTAENTTVDSPQDAQNSQAISIFEGGGFTVTITGYGSSATYQGCNANQDCLDIPEAAYYSQGTYTWENGEYSYVMAPVMDKNTTSVSQYHLQVYGPEYQTIVDEIVSPVSGRLELRPDVLDEFYRQVDNLEVCSDSFDRDISQEISLAYAIGGDGAIVELLCFMGAYQGGYEYWWYQPNESGAEFIPLTFDTYTAPESGGRTRIQIRELGGLPTYDPAQETLTLFTKYRGLSDCGAYSEYQWQGTDFELVTYRAKEECDGNAIDPAEYPQIYP